MRKGDWHTGIIYSTVYTIFDLLNKDLGLIKGIVSRETCIN
jgi:hypothetical protein